MPSFEQIVRPFQAANIINDKKIRVTRVIKVATEQALITWGSAGSAPQSEQVGARVIVKGQDVKKAFTEVSRKTTDIRIENPNDSSQFVVAKRTDEVKFSRPKPFADKQTGQPTNVAPGLQRPDIGNQFTNILNPVNSSGSTFADGLTGMTIVKTDSSARSAPVNGNPNAIAVPNVGMVTTAPEHRVETETFVIKWMDETP